VASGPRPALAEDTPSVERLRVSTSGISVEAPWGGGVIGGLGDTAVKHGDTRSTVRERGYDGTGTIGFHAGVTWHRRILYASASYDHALLFRGGALDHGSVAAGLCLPGWGAFLPFAAPSLRLWSLRAVDASDASWSSGFHASPAFDVGARVTPIVGRTRHSHEPSLFGLTFRASVPVAGGGGWIVTSVFTFYTDAS
jgi:hypothetical protein